jgi:hypothetical protein
MRSNSLGTTGRQILVVDASAVEEELLDRVLPSVVVLDQQRGRGVQADGPNASEAAPVPVRRPGLAS